MGTPEQDKALQEEKKDLAIRETDGEPEVETGVASLNCLEPALEGHLLGSNENQVDCEDAVGNRAEVEASAVFQLFPEIWDSIFPYLKPTDFESIINTSPVFRTLFESERTERLLPLWLPVFLKNVGIRQVSALLCWRGVNKTAKSFVDNLLEESSSLQNYYPDNWYLDTFGWTPVLGNAEEDLRLVVEKIKTRYSFYTEVQIQQFLDKMNSTPLVALANPFLTRSLVLEVGGSEVEKPENQLPNQLILSMVKQYGHLISSLEVGHHETDLDAPFLLPVISQLPNLKVLVLHGNITPSSEDDIARWLPQVQLNQLELLGVYYVEFGSMLPPLLRRIGPHLQRLLCSGDFLKEEANLETLRCGGHPNLRSISVDMIDMESLNQLSGLGFPLQGIKLEGRVYDLTFTHVCESLRRFADTLVRLKLSSELNTDENDINVEFPNLSTFTTDLANIHEDWFRNFLHFQAPQLTELNFEYEGQRNGSLRRPGRQVIAELQQIFETVGNLERINVFCSFNEILQDYTAEKIVMERNGQIRKIQFQWGLE